MHDRSKGPAPACRGISRPGGGLSVAVLVELERDESAGGQVKCWEHFAEAAAGLDGSLDLDLTVYLLGRREGVEALSPGVRLVTLRPRLSTAALVKVIGGVDITDIAPFHPRLAGLLPGHDVWHLTHMFAFAATAVRLSERARRLGAGHRPGLTASVHTDVPALTAAYVRRMTGGLPGTGRLWSPDAAAARLVRGRRDRLLRACDRVLVSTPGELAELEKVVGAGRVALLGRGVDRERFRADRSARAELARVHGVPADRPVVLFAGRVDASKRVLLLAEAVRRVRDRGRPVHLVVAGTGADAPAVRRLLGRDTTLLGRVPQEELARIYPGCDVFAFPSLTETAGNVVVEAMACGLPVVLPATARTTRWLSAPGEDGLVVERDDVHGWAEVLTELVDRPQLRAATGARAAATARRHHRSWPVVLTEDLVPLWHGVAPQGAGGRRGGGGAHGGDGGTEGV